jgi:Outer membrane protein
MNTFTKIAAALVTAILLVGSTAQAAGVKIGVVRTDEILKDAPQFKAAADKMRAEFQKEGAALEARRQKLAEEIKNFQRNADVMAKDKRAADEKKLSTEQLSLANDEQQFRAKVQQRNKELNQELQSQVAEVINGIAKHGGYQLVIADPVYAVPSIDITDQVLAKLKKQGSVK